MYYPNGNPDVLTSGYVHIMIQLVSGSLFRYAHCFSHFFLTFGYSRDDIASFLPVYLEKKILKVDPFQVLDQNGVGQLVRMATEKGRAIRPDLKCGICGEHGGEPSSVKFCHKVGLNRIHSSVLLCGRTSQKKVHRHVRHRYHISDPGG